MIIEESTIADLSIRVVNCEVDVITVHVIHSISELQHKYSCPYNV